MRRLDFIKSLLVATLALNPIGGLLAEKHEPAERCQESIAIWRYSPMEKLWVQSGTYVVVLPNNRY
jgi:hypothetical protein